MNSTPTGYTWHYHDDGLTMQLIPTTVHNAARHTGGVAITREAKKIAIAGLITTLTTISNAAEALDYATYLTSGNQYEGPDGKLYSWDEYSEKFLK